MVQFYQLTHDAGVPQCDPLFYILAVTVFPPYVDQPLPTLVYLLPTLCLPLSTLVHLCLQQHVHRGWLPLVYPCLPLTT